MFTNIDQLPLGTLLQPSQQKKKPQKKKLLRKLSEQFPK